MVWPAFYQRGWSNEYEMILDSIPISISIMPVLMFLFAFCGCVVSYQPVAVKCIIRPSLP